MSSEKDRMAYTCDPHFYEKLGIIKERGGIKMYSKVENYKNYKHNCR
jgi:hypothetical protein